MALRHAVLWVHRAIGLTAGLVVASLALSGMLLAIEHPVVRWAESGHRSGDGPALPLETALATAQAGRADRPSAVTVRREARAPLALSYGRELRFVDATSGRLVGGGSSARSFFHTVEEWHRFLALEGGARNVARTVVGWASLGMIALALSGPVLWWRRGGAAFRTAVLPRAGRSGAAADLDWHHAAGFWTAIPLLVVAGSGAVMALPWANAALWRAFASVAPAAPDQRPRTAPAGPWDATGIDAVVRRAQAEVPDWQTITVRVPAPGTPRVSVVADRGDGGRPDLRTQLTFDAATAALVATEPFERQEPARRARSWLRFLHTGEALGALGPFVALPTALAALVLSVTGARLAFRRMGRIPAPSAPEVIAVRAITQE